MVHKNEDLVTVIVNGRATEVKNHAELSYRDVVVLAEGVFNENDITNYTVTYSENKRSQTHDLVDGGKTVKAKEGMIFNVTPTDKS